MNWPLVSRRAWEVRGELVEALRAQVAELKAQNDQLKDLFDKTSQFEVVEQEGETVKLKSKPVVIGAGRAAASRSGRQQREEATIPEPADSVKALERRVSEAGGKV
jgi:hypothetical protein